MVFSLINELGSGNETMSNKGKKGVSEKLSVTISIKVAINNVVAINCIVFMDSINISFDAKEVT